MSKALIQKVRKLIHVNQGHQIYQPYMKKGKKTITMKYYDIKTKKKEKIYTDKYMVVPLDVYNKAKKHGNKWTPIETVIDPSYNGKRMKQQLFHGNFSIDEVKDYAQKLSNKLGQRNRNGKLVVAIDIDGQYRSGGLTTFGDNVRLYAPSDSSYISVLPDTTPRFSIVFTNN